MKSRERAERREEERKREGKEEKRREMTRKACTRRFEYLCETILYSSIIIILVAVPVLCYFCLLFDPFIASLKRN